MTGLRCRCGAFIVDEVVHLEDTAEGWYVVTDVPVADHVHECRCGRDWFVSSTQPVTECVGQLRIVA